MNKHNFKSLIVQLKQIGWRIITTVILTLTAVVTVWVYAAFVEPTAGPNDSDQDFAQNILGANNANNDFDSSLVTANKDGSIIERAEYIIDRLTTQGEWYSTECGESTTSTQTTCYVDDIARYLTTDLCNEAKENQCFVPTDNSYYAFGSECVDSTTTTKINCYVDDTAKYVDADACSAASNTGYCYMNTATFSGMDGDLAAAKIKKSTTIFGVTGTYVKPTATTCGSFTSYKECSTGDRTLLTAIYSDITDNQCKQMCGNSGASCAYRAIGMGCYCYIGVGIMDNPYSSQTAALCN